MGYFKPNIIIGRIKSASAESPIAVFLCNKPLCLDAVFADTAESKRKIQAKEGLVGVYDKTMDIQAIATELQANICNP